MIFIVDDFHDIPNILRCHYNYFLLCWRLFTHVSSSHDRSVYSAHAWSISATIAINSSLISINHCQSLHIYYLLHKRHRAVSSCKATLSSKSLFSPRIWSHHESSVNGLWGVSFWFVVYNAFAHLVKSPTNEWLCPLPPRLRLLS